MRPLAPPPSPVVLTGLTVLAAVAALALGGCGSPIPGSAQPVGSASTSARPPDAADPSGPPTSGSAPRDRAGACEVTLSGRGNIQVNGGGTRAVTRNGVTSLGCADGPLVEVEVSGGAVTFTPDGGAAVRIASGETAEVDAYEITVDEAAGDTAEFVVVPPA